MLAYDYPILGIFWSMLMFFIWIAWLMVLFNVIIDIFRSSINGFGKAVFPDGGVYEGQLKEDMATGKGIYRAPDGTVYNGQFVSNQPDGNFEITRPDESTATEVWKNGERTIW